jgi:glucose/arabinose dehydrogenase
LYVYDDPAGGVASRDVANNRNARLSRFTAQTINGIWSIVPNSELVLLGKNSTWANISNPNSDSTNNLSLPASGVTINPDGSRTNLNDYIAVDSQSHGPGTVVFGPDGKLYITVGDGTSYSDTDRRAIRVQDINNLSGKVLRIDPDTGAGLADNPFWTGNTNDNASKVFALGLRNGFRSVFSPTGQLVVADVGWNLYEEINFVNKGANLGWPYYEGGQGVALQTGGYRDLAEAKAFYNNPPANLANASYAYYHNGGGGNSIMAGDFYTKPGSPFTNTLFASDMSQGWVKALTFDANGVFQNKEQTIDEGSSVQYIVDMNMGSDGNMYYANLVSGQIGRWMLA